MTTGRKPKPIALHIADGTFRKDRHAPAGATEKAAFPERPASLDGEARKFWDRIAAELAPLGLLGKIDVPLLESLCEMHSLYAAALAEAKRNPLSKEARVGLTHYADHYHRLLSECGLTPVARARLKIDTSDKPVGVSSRKRGVS